ncbi:hypothetical protein, partial [Bacteroides eggerthii]|uniref:hypothetical protein n=1 Tax=Bacteroides eggerthii TaxID=28111 RepID=UPI001E481AFA
FLSEISKLFHKWLIDKQVEEHDFLKGNKGERKIHNIYTHARTGGRIGGHKGGRFQAGHYLKKPHNSGLVITTTKRTPK